LGRPETVPTALIAAIAVAAHLSHLPTAPPLVVLLPLLGRGWRPLLRVAAPVAAAMLFLFGASGRPSAARRSRPTGRSCRWRACKPTGRRS
jgi:hypothetical protein